METSELPKSDFRSKSSETILRKPELSHLVEWYSEQLKNFGEMTVEAAPLTDGNQWKAELTPSDEVNAVDGAFFTLKGQTVTRKNPDGSVSYQWTQPGLLQKESEMDLPVKEGTERVKISGFVGVVMDGEGNVLLTLAQEPFAQTPKNVLVRTPFQTSAAKLQGVLEGKKELDPPLFDLLTAVTPGKTPDEIFRLGIVETFPLPYADANRIAATNIGFVMRVTEPALIDTLKNNGKNRWCNPKEVTALARTGLLNGHTAAAILAAK